MGIIDHVKMGGYKDNFELYTIDLDEFTLDIEPEMPSKSKREKWRQRHERQRKKNERWNDEFDMHSFFEKDQDIRNMRMKFTDEFFCRFKMAYLNYEAGEWSVAKDMLENCRFMLATEDGPSATLLRYVKRYDCTAPSNWKGYRVILDT